MPSPIVFGIIKSLHDLFTVLWVGGIFITLLVLMPTLKSLFAGNDAALKINTAYQTRLRVIAVISIVGLWVTGLLLGRQSQAYSGFLQFNSLYSALISIKHISVFLMVVVAAIRGFVFGKPETWTKPKKVKAAMGLLMLNGIFGLVVLFLSGISAALG